MGITPSGHTTSANDSPIDHLSQHLCLRDHLSLYSRDALHPASRPADLENFHLQAKLVAGSYRAPEPDPVQAHEVDHLSIRALHRPHHQATAGLCHGLDDQHPGHDGVAWKVTLKEGLVDRDVLEADDTGRALDFDDAIDEKKRVAMRESLKDSFDIH